MLQLDKIFLGSTKTDQRKYIFDLLRLGRGFFSRVIIPCCGQFSLAKVALEAGYKPEQIYTSDISLFSSILGTLASGQPLETLPMQVLEPYAQHYRGLSDDLDRAAYLMYLMKACQLDPDKPYEGGFRVEFDGKPQRYIEQARAALTKYSGVYAGIHYAIQDLREVVSQPREATDVVITNPPVFSKGYTKMFNFDGTIQWSVNVPEFNWGKEYMQSLVGTYDRENLFVWYRAKNREGIDLERVWFCKECSATKRDYWVVNRPQIMERLGAKRAVVGRRPKVYKPLKARTIDAAYQITPQTKISFVNISKENAMYYRDLWVHKLGSTQAERYVAMLLDGYVFGVVGFHIMDAMRMKSDCIYETFGFSSPLEGYTTHNRLLMMSITCMEFRDWLMQHFFRRTRLVRLNGFRTTCLTKYRKAKQNNNLLQVVAREKMDNGMYKVKYYTPWYERTWSDCVALYLQELAQGHKL